MEKERGIRCLATGTGWLYEWASNGMRKKVIRDRTERPGGVPLRCIGTTHRQASISERLHAGYGTETYLYMSGAIKPLAYKSNEAGTLPKELAEYVTTWVFRK
ncbi:hypothetical protein NXW50_13690 [Bacteroides thetaiotaomicron]|nr:hypothetical protein [Bacteroides thetaiotaomicron]MCS2279201.1 hypothetical protein [Bacteroides thetaiotaomicron]